MATAAFFDLDRTLLGGASGPGISSALRATGLMPDRRIPGESLLFGLFNLVGENRPSMMLARQMARAATGWSTETVDQAGEMAADILEPLVQPYARVLIDAHHAEGRRVVVATTTPEPLVAPLARRLGLDAVIATRWTVADGRYTGSIDGPFVWARGKLEAVRAWADAEGVDLDASHAYSDSWFDVPLLSAVGHPVAVNPDPRLAAMAMLRRWPLTWLDVPPGVPKIVGFEPQRLLMPFARPELLPWANVTVTGTEHVPPVGGVILVSNHRSYFDPLAVGFAIARIGRPARFLGKKEVFDAPIVGDVARAMGGIRVDRGTGSDEPLEEAARALEAGEMVVILPQGTIPRGRAFFDPELRGRWGAARLAASTGAPVVPIGLWGTEKVWPRSSKLPNVLNVLDPPHVTVRVGPPVVLDHLDPDEDTRRMMSAITSLLPPEARQAREPTEEELALATPSGHADDNDAVHEAERRPGAD
jgi:putative phosphoserine phosphatase / 1-acylglycerol-3-phosphate O-acyltransferase